MLPETTKTVKIRGVPPKVKGVMSVLGKEGNAKLEYKISQLHFHVTHMCTPTERALNKHSFSSLLI